MQERKDDSALNHRLHATQQTATTPSPPIWFQPQPSSSSFSKRNFFLLSPLGQRLWRKEDIVMFLAPSFLPSFPAPPELLTPEPTNRQQLFKIQIVSLSLPLPPFFLPSFSFEWQLRHGSFLPSFFPYPLLQFCSCFQKKKGREGQ